MSNRFPHLFQSGAIGCLRLKNRMVMAPMSMHYMDGQGRVTPQMIDYYVERARGGVGLIITEAVYPRPTGYPGRLTIATDDAISGLKSLSDAIHSAGAKVVMELNPSRGRVDEVEPVSASDVVFKGIKPRPLTVTEIEQLLQYIAAGAVRAKKAGFDGIMIHGGSGYLVGEFLSPLTNKRTDSYGGNLEGRAKFAVELTKATRKSVGRGFVVIFRLMSSERVPGGFSGQDATLVAQMLEKAGADAIDVVSGSIAQDTLEWAVAPAAIPLAFNTELSALIKPKVGIPVMVAGRINTPELAESILAEGKADFITLGREVLTDPYFPQKAAEGRTEDILRCLGCVNCDEDFHLKQAVTCTVNPALGRERELAIKPAARPKSVLVVGGGPGGMEAALVAALRGHRVVLCEREKRLGGQLNQASLPPYKTEIGALKDYLSTQLKKAGVRVELEREVAAESMEQFKPEVVVVATGSRPRIPQIPGANLPMVADARKVLNRSGVKGNRFVVIGGGMVGVETAEFLADLGKRVTVVEILDTIAADVPHLTRKMLMPRLSEKGVRLLTSIQCDRISEKGVSISHPNGTKELLEADAVVLATGSMAENSLFSALKDKLPEVYQIGDCCNARKLKNALHEGAMVGQTI